MLNQAPIPMDFDFTPYNQLMFLIGELTVIILLGALVSAFILALI